MKSPYLLLNKEIGALQVSQLFERYSMNLKNRIAYLYP